MGSRPGPRFVALTTAASLALAGLTVTVPSAFAAVDDGTTNAFTSNPDAKFANEIFFFDFSKVASGEQLENKWDSKNPENNEGGFGGKRIKEGDTYTYKDTDGLPKGMEVTVTIKSIKAIYPDAKSSNGTPLTVENGGIWARNVTWNDFFRPLDFAALAGRNSDRDKWFDREVLYPSDPGAKWQISQYLNPDLFNNNADSVGNQGYTFDLDIQGTLNGKPISLDVVASDGESTGIKVEGHNNPYGSNLEKGGVPENLGLVTNADGGWQVIQDLVGKDKRYYYVDNTPTVPTKVPNGKDPYAPIVVTPESEWSLQNGDKSYGWVDTELNEEGGEWKSIPQSQPLLVSRGAKTVSVTLDNHPRGKTGSRQGVVAGIFIPTDQGDAPKSYGEASHILDNWNVTGQPKQNPDVKFEPKNRVGTEMPTRDGGKNWSDDAKKDSEEDVQPNVFKDGFENANGKVTFPVTATGSDVVAWVDLDNNGTFDESERRVGVLKDGNATFDWSDADKKPEPGKDYYARIRVGGDGVKADDMKQPTGVIPGGEVEDLKFMVDKKPEPLVSLGDKVWFDQDFDGLQTDGEPGVKGVKVSLLNEQGQPFNRPGTQEPYVVTTGENGEYLFENLPKGKYKVQFDYSAARTTDGRSFASFTLPSVVVNGSDEKDSDVIESNNGIGSARVIDLQGDRRDVDAGLVVVSVAPKVSVGDFVWHDKNNDGIQNDGEDSGIPGVELRLLDPEGKPVKSTVTDAEGKYLFEDLPVLKDGQSYTVEVLKNPEGFAPAKTGGTEDAEKDSSTKSAKTTPGTLTKDKDKDLSLDFGFIKLGSLSGMTWFDANRDGIRDDNEKPRAGVTVTLLKDGKPVEGVDPVETKEDGTYTFEGLIPGVGYSVRFGDKENLTKKTEGDVTKDKDSNADPNTGETATAEVKAGENTPNLDAGYIFEPTTKNSVTVAHQGETQKSTDNDPEKFGNITDEGITPAEMFPDVDPALPVEYSLVDASGNPTDKVEVPGQGTYTVDNSGVVTFEPHPDFVGTAKTVVVTAKQGEVTHTAKYTPIVVPKDGDGEFPLPHFVDKGETGEPVTVTPGKGNHPDYPADLLPETVKFVEDGQPKGAVISEDGKKMTVPGQGVWTIDEDGSFTFTPEGDFVGSPDTVKYNGEDANGNPGTNNGTVTITYPIPEGNGTLIGNLLIAGGIIGGVGLLAGLVSGATGSSGSSSAPNAAEPTQTPKAEPAKAEPTKVAPKAEEKKSPMLATTGASVLGLLVAALVLVLAGAALIGRRKNK
ncbi:SdrD B-like domain-containing protein [Corynebacterium pseudotuberculosis]|uniref:Cna B-type domain-containing protein n=2 Tax=Corynebacterium pseudotuberculosis TaxID=1719 RepID=D9QCN2_CORP2|nr:SdrD B-like domain-containing protein [Corynebacterium pseudotuberculosis]ADL11308.1 Cna B-type domain-containing protein [Corynebacterium pseudotuberculosis C231]ADL21720.1 Cna B-type domain-containing protein [Corynebacterium pseudotuberculosis 1002]AFF23008.1 Sdr family related adhesin [Corynebacterium pseudotuberculosis P54B96]AIG06072.1 hypothetical protein CPTA_00243 [Corynebacterium pseudotuberculosis]AIG09342.1 hypothetical protein CPTB_01286 [Corynebacterium pseudotuberculosis]